MRRMACRSSNWRKKVDQRENQLGETLFDIVGRQLDPSGDGCSPFLHGEADRRSRLWLLWPARQSCATSTNSLGGQGPVTRAEMPAGVRTPAIFCRKSGSEERSTSAKPRIAGRGIALHPAFGQGIGRHRNCSEDRLDLLIARPPFLQVAFARIARGLRARGWAPE